jgi:hypothetical protein
LKRPTEREERPIYGPSVRIRSFLKEGKIGQERQLDYRKPEVQRAARLGRPFRKKIWYIYFKISTYT